MGKIFVLAVSVVVGFSLAVASFVLAANEEFYRGKVIRIVVGFSAGGGFDTYARSVSRYMGKYILVNPTILVENMTGAGSLIAANHVYKVAKPDGLTIGAFNGNQILNQLVGAQSIEFDARKMGWVGAPGLQPRSLPAQPKNRDHQCRTVAFLQDTSQTRRERSWHTDGRRTEDSQGSDRSTYAPDNRLQRHRRYSGCGGVR